MTTNNAAEKGAPRHARFLRTHVVAKVMGLVLVAAIAGVSSGAYAFVRHYQGNIDSNDTTFLAAKDKKTKDPSDPDAGHDLNILILGSDSRGGANGKIVKDDNGGQRSDTTIVLHISADRKRMEAVSIPRDSIVDIPACQIDAKGHSTGAAPATMFNAAFSFGADKAKAEGGDASAQIAGGAACTWQTVESTTGITLDGYVVLDFSGFEGMINALGGVPMCIPTKTVVPKADLDLDAGYQTLKGKEALGYARAREGIGDGSDTGRIKRQQELMGAISNKVFAQNFLTDAPKLFKFLDAATKSLHTSKTDGGLNLSSVTSLVGLGLSLRHMSSSDVTFLTIPNGPYPANHNRLVWTEPAASEIWDKLAEDKPLTAAEEKAAKKAKASATAKATSKATSGTSDKSSGTTKKPTTPATPKDRDKDGITAADVVSSKGACTS
ncbi:transcriptional regulator [Luteimicrobium album]|uniref:Transcriptional regulator n=1 Tax=Luteimicrobium album TaxID=1054550 RepID=A0ABQ6I4I5_9MICO|nr:LCP family protein [Luteimicrobium album]GMA25053.1 transcriptional regulator [Luteimicrobium album]